MKLFVLANKNALKKFRQTTGTNSTMTMLKEVFGDDPVSKSGPLGGDAELVVLIMCCGGGPIKEIEWLNPIASPIVTAVA